MTPLWSMQFHHQAMPPMYHQEARLLTYSIMHHVQFMETIHLLQNRWQANKALILVCQATTLSITSMQGVQRC